MSDAYTNTTVKSLTTEQVANGWMAAGVASEDEVILAGAMYLRICDLTADGFEAELTDALDYVYKVMGRYTNAGKSAPEPMRDLFGVLKRMEDFLGQEKR